MSALVSCRRLNGYWCIYVGNNPLITCVTLAACLDAMESLS